MHNSLIELPKLSTTDKDYNTKLQALVKSMPTHKIAFNNEFEFNYFMLSIMDSGGKTCSLWWDSLKAIIPDEEYSKIRNKCYYGDKPLLTLEVEKTKIVGFNLERLVVRGIKYQPTGDTVVEFGKISTYDTVIQLLELLPTIVGDLLKVIVRETTRDAGRIDVTVEPNGNVCGFMKTFYCECTLESMHRLANADILVKDTNECIDILNKILFNLNMLIYKANCWVDEQKEIIV